MTSCGPRFGTTTGRRALTARSPSRIWAGCWVRPIGSTPSPGSSESAKSPPVRRIPSGCGALHRRWSRSSPKRGGSWISTLQSSGGRRARRGGRSTADRGRGVGPGFHGRSRAPLSHTGGGCRRRCGRCRDGRGLAAVARARGPRESPRRGPDESADAGPGPGLQTGQEHHRGRSRAGRRSGALRNRRRARAARRIRGLCREGLQSVSAPADSTTLSPLWESSPRSSTGSSSRSW